MPATEPTATDAHRARPATAPPASAVVARPSGLSGDAYHHGDLRAACVAAGLRLATVGGPDAVTIRGVARLAGVSHTAPLHHFRDRDELLAAVAEAGFDRLVADAEDAVAGPVAGDPIERIRRYGLAYIRGAIGAPGLYRLMFGEAACDTGYGAYERLVRLVAESGLADGDPEPIALVFWAQVHGLAGLYADGKLAHELEGLAPGEVPRRAVDALDRLIDLLALDATRRAASRRPARPSSRPKPRRSSR
jgi:AcrR family transcriptional regulator